MARFLEIVLGQTHIFTSHSGLQLDPYSTQCARSQTSSPPSVVFIALAKARSFGPAVRRRVASGPFVPDHPRALRLFAPEAASMHLPFSSEVKVLVLPSLPERRSGRSRSSPSSSVACSPDTNAFGQWPKVASPIVAPRGCGPYSEGLRPR